jgi:DNA-binding MarR family transcriptional regulator
MPAAPTDAHIAKLLERIGEVALALRRGKGMAQDLSALQLRVLGFVADRGAEPVGVALLADALQISRPTASDSVRVLVERGFLLRRPDPTDRRSHALRLTATGRQAAANALATPLLGALVALPQAHKEGTLIALMRVLEALVHSGDVRVQRLCFTCKHYRGDKAHKHHCMLLHTDLAVHQLRTDCPDHLAALNVGPHR